MQFQASFPLWEHSGQISGQNTSLIRLIFHFLTLIAVSIPRPIDFLRCQRSSSCLLPSDSLVEKSKFVPAFACSQQNSYVKTHRK